MGFQDVEFQPFRASFSTIFPKNSGWGKQGYDPCNILLFQQRLFLCQTNLMKIIIRLSQS